MSTLPTFPCLRCKAQHEATVLQLCAELAVLRSRLEVAAKALEELRDRAVNPQAGLFDRYLVADWCNSALATIRGAE